MQGGGRAAPASRDAAPTVPLLSMDMAESAVRSLRPVAGRRGGVAGSIAAPAAAASTLATEPAAGTPGRGKRGLGTGAQAQRAGARWRLAQVFVECLKRRAWEAGHGRRLHAALT